MQYVQENVLFLREKGGRNHEGEEDYESGSSSDF